MSLDDVFQAYVCQKAMIEHASTEANNVTRGSFLERIQFPGRSVLPNQARDREVAVAGIKKRLLDRLEDIFLVALVAEFERTFFERLKHAIGEAGRALDAGYDPNAPLASFRHGLLRSIDDFRNLSGIKPLISGGGLGDDLIDQLANTIELRNFIAHGRRQDWSNARTMPLVADTPAAYAVLKKVAAAL